MIETVSTILFALAVAHVFVAGRVHRFARRLREGSAARAVFSMLGEVELVFGFWAIIYIAVSVALRGRDASFAELRELSFVEALFVVAIMTVAASRPIVEITRRMIFAASRALPRAGELGFLCSALVIGPIAGSLITEPAAMTVTAILLQERFFSRPISPRFKYAALATLFVNVSIGGTLTPFAAPPVLIVAGKWEWGLGHMLAHFGWKAALAIVLNTALLAALFRKELRNVDAREEPRPAPLPLRIAVAHLALLAAVIAGAHRPAVFLGALAVFLVLFAVTPSCRDTLRLKEGLFVGAFLAGLVVLGHPQRWWIEPWIRSMSALPLYLGTAVLTAITDNAALTYLGSQVPNLSESHHYALVAGAVVGGGLTVIANAPNPAGYAILHRHFGDEGILAGRLFRAALLPTAIALIAFLF